MRRKASRRDVMSDGYRYPGPHESDTLAPAFATDDKTSQLNRPR